MLTDQTLVATIASQDKDAQVRIAAVGKLTDQGTLSTVAVIDKDPDVRVAAVNKLTDQALLERIASADRSINDIKVTWAATVRLDVLRAGGSK
jgi:hypothetical protein